MAVDRRCGHNAREDGDLLPEAREGEERCYLQHVEGQLVRRRIRALQGQKQTGLNTNMAEEEVCVMKTFNSLKNISLFLQSVLPVCF